MRKALALMMVVALMLGAVAAPVSASINYDSEGRIVHGANYDGPGFGTDDLALLGVGAAVVAHSLTWTSGAHILAPASFIVWGAMRTNKHRPEGIHVIRNKGRVVVGTVDEVLGS